MPGSEESLGGAHDHGLGAKQALNSNTAPISDKNTSDEKGHVSEFSNEELLGAVWGNNNPQDSDSRSMANEAPAAVEHADSDTASVEPLSPMASRRPGPAHCDADELWAAWHWGNGALHGASAPNMAQCASHPPHAPKKRHAFDKNHDKTDGSKIWVLRARRCMCWGFWGKVWKGARDGAKGIASGTKGASCALGTAFDTTARQHPYPCLAAAGVAAGLPEAAAGLVPLLLRASRWTLPPPVSPKAGFKQARHKGSRAVSAQQRAHIIKA
ncbi:hypothetical protein WJX82_008189 [Trebouxia sp. C0006]